VMGTVGRRVNTGKKCIHMHVIAIMVPVVTIPWMGKRGWIQVWCIWHVVRTFTQCTPTQHNNKGKNFFKSFHVFIYYLCPQNFKRI
jgi:hypothetical protein